MNTITQNCMMADMPDKIYHADPCVEPSLSSSMARIFIDGTEEEARLSSKRLNPDYEEKESSSMNFGTIAHDFILRGEQKTFEVVPFEDFRTKDAQVMRDHIIERGLIPLNKKTAPEMIDQCKSMRFALDRYLSTHEEFPGLMSDGKGEVSAFYKHPVLGIWMRARFDWLDNKYPDIVVDYKTTALTFKRWDQNELWGEEGAYMQSPHYREVYTGVTGRMCRFLYVVQRTVKPYDVRIIEIDQAYDEKVKIRHGFAKMRFANCMKTKEFRGQPPKLFSSYPPPWVQNSWEIDEIEEEMKASMKSQEPNMGGNYAV